MRYHMLFFSCSFVLIFTVNAFSLNPFFGEPPSHCYDFVKLGQPSLPKSTDPVICHFAFLIGYNISKRDPYWVAEHLTKAHVEHPIYPRTNIFLIDPALDNDKQAKNSDYTDSGYDRGHMDPAADNQWGKIAETESFYLTNIVPQNHLNNTGIWATLEKDIRTWTSLRGELYIVTGPVFGVNPKFIGDDQVEVPSEIYKIIYDPNSDDVISFIIPNKNIDPSTLEKYLVSEKTVEKITGLTFIPLVSDEVREKTPQKLWPIS